MVKLALINFSADNQSISLFIQIGPNKIYKIYLITKLLRMSKKNKSI